MKPESMLFKRPTNSALYAVSLACSLFTGTALADNTAETTADTANKTLSEIGDSIEENVKEQLQNIGAAGNPEMLPRWQIGLGALQLNSTDYPGSDNPNNPWFALPYFIYRGDTLSVGDGGVSAKAYENERFTVTMSLAGSVAANSEGNELREGLPEIGFTFELGPQLVATLYDEIGENGIHNAVVFATQARAAFETDFSDVESIGGVFATVLEWQHGGYFDERFGFYVELGSKWATEGVHDLFYEVDTEFANNARPAYDAKGGYLGSDLTFGLAVTPHPRLTVYAGISEKFYAGAANTDSPLFETDRSANMWIGGTLNLFESKELVSVLRE